MSFLSTIETKVIAAAAGSGLGAASATFILWALGVAVWNVPSAANRVTDAVAAVPAPVSALVAIVVTLVGAFTAGYAAPHTSRSVPAGVVLSSVFTGSSAAPSAPVLASLPADPVPVAPAAPVDPPAALPVAPPTA